jgi:hypothetical protein
MLNLPVLNVIREVIIQHYPKSVIHVIRLPITIQPILNIQPWDFRKPVNYAINLHPDGNLPPTLNMTVNLFRYIPASIRENGMHVQNVTQILPVTPFLPA